MRRHRKPTRRTRQMCMRCPALKRTLPQENIRAPLSRVGNNRLGLGQNGDGWDVYPTHTYSQIQNELRHNPKICTCVAASSKQTTKDHGWARIYKIGTYQCLEATHIIHQRYVYHNMRKYVRHVWRLKCEHGETFDF